MSTLSLINLVYFANLATLLGFLVHLVIAFRPVRARLSPFYGIWLLAWLCSFALYVSLVISSYYGFRATGVFIWEQLTRALDVGNSLALILCSEILISLRVRGDFYGTFNLKYRIYGWSLLALTVMVLNIAASSILLSWGPLPASIFSFLAVALYVGRYESCSPASAREWVVVGLYLYAGLNMLWVYASDAIIVSAIFIISFPLKFLLYYSGYSILLAWSKISGPSLESLGSTARPPVTEASGKDAPLQSDSLGHANGVTHIEAGWERVNRQGSPPDPKVTVQLTGLWGFLYILWRYQSGRSLIALALASLILGAIFFSENAEAIGEFFANYLAKLLGG